jgi:hypothetical protein
MQAQRLYRKLGYSVLWGEIKANRLVVGLNSLMKEKTLNTAMCKPLQKSLFGW